VIIHAHDIFSKFNQNHGDMAAYGEIRPGARISEIIKNCVKETVSHLDPKTLFYAWKVQVIWQKMKQIN
jgi:hypothetical protein